tara:strand:- start:45 stop:1760 length:1716 start_codon:yes stop_codon:yes gene_type:complete
MISYEDVKQRVPLSKVIERYGHQLTKGSRMACPIHGGDNKASFAVHDQGRKWTCHTRGCGKGSSVIDFVALKEGVGVQEAFIMLKDWYNLNDDVPVKKVEKPYTQVGEPIEHKYYKADGGLAYTIKRIDKSNGDKVRKECIPELPNGSHSLPSDVRVMYNLPAITKSGLDFICFCEGEKTADALIECGFIGTTFTNGSSGWLDQYAENLADKDVVLMPDADEGGQKWLKLVSDGLRGKVKRLRTVTVPDEFVRKYPQYSGHDFADMLAEGGVDRSTNWLTDSIIKAPSLERGVDRASLNVMTDVCQSAYIKAENMTDDDGLNLSRMFGREMDVRVSPADLMMIIAPTGVGKSRVLANIPFFYENLNFAIFDLELSEYQLGMRGIAYHNKMSFTHAENAIRNGVPKVTVPRIENVFLPKIASLNIEKLKAEVDRIEDFQERRVDVVAIDYISKMNRMGSMTDSIISNCSDFKRYLVEEERMGIITTQSRRIAEKEMKYNMPSKEDAIYTSAIEQNCQQAICCCFGENDHNTLLVNCDKYSHGQEPENWVEMDLMDMRMRYRGVHRRSEDGWE